MSKHKNTFDILPPHKTLELDPAVIQAVWRCMLGGNDHWVTYRCKDRTNPHSGVNDQKWSTGHIDKRGVDRRRHAGVPYNFTAEAVDRKRLCFAFWGLNGVRHKQMCTYACSDFEPLKPARKTKKPQPVQLTEVGSRIHPKPTLKHRIRVYRQALNCYNDTVGLFFNDDRILAAYLVESSPDHYHAGIIFSRPLPRREHDEILAQINRPDMYLPDLDKDSRRAKEGFGDAFRAPLTWKHGYQARIIQWYCKDTEALVRIGESLKPPGLGQKPHRKSTYDRTIKDPSNPAVVLAWAIAHYPITPTTRDATQASLILALLHRKIDVDIIRQIGPLWLQHSNNQATEPNTQLQNFKTDQTTAEKAFNYCLNYTLKNPRLQIGTRPTTDPTTTIGSYQLTAGQLNLVKQVLQMGKRKGGEGSTCHPLHEGDDNTTLLDAFPVSLRSSAYFIESLFVQLEINRLKGENGLRCTHQQLIDIIKQRHGLEIDPRQFQRVKMRFCSLPREGRPYHHASKIELLVETLKGTKGLPSEYELAPLLADVLIQMLG